MNFMYVLFFVSIATALQCMDENNKPVDWFIAYKFPTIKRHGKLLKSGVAYTYLTSEDPSQWKFSNVSINSTSSIIGRTLSSLYTENNDIMYILYNDQPPNRKSKTTKGHNKGVVVSDTEGGFWLVHSVPHFPSMGANYTYPRTGSVFGQSFLCISLDLPNLDKVGIQLQYNQPQIYGENILANLKASLPELSKAADNITNTEAPWYHVSSISTKKGVNFTSFAKSRNFNKDLYEDLVAPFLQSDLLVETWLDGPGRLSSNCSKKFKVNNIDEISFKSFNITFKSTNDHSKWAVSPVSDTQSWICIGDINRSEHQKVRGGGTVCLKNKQVIIDYQKIVSSIENCPKTVTE